MTPAQIALVEQTMAALDMDALAVDFYRRAFTRSPDLGDMFTTEPETQRARFITELTVIVGSIRAYDDFAPTVRALGLRHRRYGVLASHYRLMGEALLAALAAQLGDLWTSEVGEAWRLAYNLIAETMMGASYEPMAAARRG